MQGEKLSGETDEQFTYRSNRVKALLFLHTFKYDYIGTNLNVFDRNKRNGLIEEVPKDQLAEREKFWIDFYQSKQYGLNEKRG